MLARFLQIEGGAKKQIRTPCGGPDPRARRADGRLAEPRGKAASGANFVIGCGCVVRLRRDLRSAKAKISRRNRISVRGKVPRKHLQAKNQGPTFFYKDFSTNQRFLQDIFLILSMQLFFFALIFAGKFTLRNPDCPDEHILWCKHTGSVCKHACLQRVDSHPV